MEVAPNYNAQAVVSPDGVVFREDAARHDLWGAQVQKRSECNQHVYSTGGRAQQQNQGQHRDEQEAKEATGGHARTGIVAGGRRGKSPLSKSQTSTSHGTQLRA